MRHRTHVVFDDYVNGNIDSDARFNAMLGEHDALALHAIADNASAVNVSIGIYVMHSSEGRQWLYRNTGGTTLPATPEISFTMTGGATDILHKMWSDACLSSGTATGGPLLSFVRLHIVTGNGGAHLKVHLTQRGPHG